MNKEDVIKNKNDAINVITDFLDECLETDNEIKKVHIISYWLKDYINYIKEEKDFRPTNLKTYERGDIVKVNLGFNIGSELGGLHYCVVIDKKIIEIHLLLRLFHYHHKKQIKLIKIQLFWVMIFIKKCCVSLRN